MNSRAAGLISFIVGGCVGFTTALIFLKNKYERMYIESTESMERVYKDLIVKEKGYKSDDEGGEEPEVLAKLNREKPDLNEFARETSKNHKFVDYSKHQEIKTVAEAEAEDIPEEPEETPEHYTIDPNEFGEFEDYRRIFLTYYADGVLADSDDEILDDEDIENSIGTDFADYFGEYEDDSVHIRNDRLKCDYEILADVRTLQKALDDKQKG